MDTKEKIYTFIKHIGISPSEFERSCNLGHGLIPNIGKTISKSTLNKILAVYPELNRAWIEDDVEPMLKQTASEFHLPEKLSEVADSRIKTYGCTDCITKQKEIDKLEAQLDDLRKSVESHRMQLKYAEEKIHSLSECCDRKKANGL